MIQKKGPRNTICTSVQEIPDSLFSEADQSKKNKPKKKNHRNQNTSPLKKIPPKKTKPQTKQFVVLSRQLDSQRTCRLKNLSLQQPTFLGCSGSRMGCSGWCLLCWQFQQLWYPGKLRLLWINIFKQEAGIRQCDQVVSEADPGWDLSRYPSIFECTADAVAE